MPGGGEYEPQDSRKVTGTSGDPSKSWRQQEDPREGRGEYEPRDQRNVTGQPTQERDRWHNDQAEPPKAEGQPAKGVREAEPPPATDE
ncbi:hypothetical protein [Novosphingobium gossypii]|uniref:hypothetical protein n=1 Tax=Novosphingobium gossypii TaxID=1604774 RepID=UPI003D21F256